VKVSTANPQLYTGTDTTISYWVKGGDGKFYHVYGKVVIYSMHVGVATVQTGWDTLYGQYPAVFSGEKFWLRLSSQVWDSAFQQQYDPITGKSTMGQAWEAPLAVVVSDYALTGQSLHDDLQPVNSGHEFALYASPAEVNELAGVPVQQLNSSMSSAGALRPDSRLQDEAWFSIQLTDFGQEVVNGGVWPFGSVVCPSADYTLTVYTLQLGVYTYTNPDDTPWKAEEDDSTPAWWDAWAASAGAWFAGVGAGIASWFSNPFNTVAFGVVLLIAVAALAIIFLTSTRIGRSADAALAKRSSRAKKGSLRPGSAFLVLGLVMLSAGIALPMAGVSLPTFPSLSIMDEDAPTLAVSCRSPVQVGAPATINARLGYTVYGNMAAEPFGGELLKFYLDGIYAGSATTSQDAEPALCGRASYTVTATTPGTHTIKVEWAGNANHTGLTASCAFTAAAADPGSPPEEPKTTGSCQFLNAMTAIGVFLVAVGATALVLGAAKHSRRGAGWR